MCERSSGMAGRSSSSRGDLRLRERLICEFDQRRFRPPAKRGAERRYRWVTDCTFWNDDANP
jgi:hypothetical protein